MDVGQMQRQLVEYTKSLFIEGYLDSQFLQLQQLQDESNPSFVAEVVSLFFEDSERILKDLTFALEQKIIDFKKVDAHVHQFKGSSSSIGAQRVKNACIAFRGYCEEQNVNSCIRCLQQVKQEYFLVKNKLETLFRLEHQIIGAGGQSLWWNWVSEMTFGFGGEACESVFVISFLLLVVDCVLGFYFVVLCVIVVMNQ